MEHVPTLRDHVIERLMTRYNLSEEEARLAWRQYQWRILALRFRLAPESTKDSN